MNADLTSLRKAILDLHGCESTWIETVHIKETFQDQDVWEGDIEVFDLHGHDLASKCYAWSYPTKGGKHRFYAVLHIPPVDSALKAVQAAIVSGR